MQEVDFLQIYYDLTEKSSPLYSMGGKGVCSLRSAVQNVGGAAGSIVLVQRCLWTDGKCTVDYMTTVNIR